MFVHYYGTSPSVNRWKIKKSKDFKNSSNKDVSMQRIQSLYKSIDNDIGVLDKNDNFMLIMENRKHQYDLE